ncbi:MAG: HAD-IC family P-type ATPase, partial [Coleofasciculus sp. S288]|nr:HAD-IC family P-type ATPase [Coleofasciculus sp. S288]
YFLRQEGVYLNGQPEKHARQTHSVIYVASNGELQGAIAYRDPLRSESREVMKALQVEGMEIHLLTGDKKQTAIAVAGELGIEPAYTHAEAFPEQKVEVVKGLHEQGKTVAFVGDGINDSPALAYADVSVSFANGSDVARETADVVLMDNNLRGLPEAIAIARQALQIIHENTAIVAIPNLGALALAVVTGIPPLAATLVNNGSAIVAGLNGLRPLWADNEVLNLLSASLDTDTQEQDSYSLQPGEAGEQVTNPPSVPEIPLNLQQSLDTSTDDLTSESHESLNGSRKHQLEEGLQELNGKPRTGVAPSAVEPENKQQPVAEIQLDAQQRLEPISVPSNSASTESLNGAGHQRMMKGFQRLKNEPLTAVALADRLNVSTTTISRRKSKPDFPNWSSSKDPHGLVWKYSKQSKLFVAV